MHPLEILMAVGAAFLLRGLLLAFAASPANATGSCSTGRPGAVSATSFSSGRGAEVSGDLTVTPRPFAAREHPTRRGRGPAGIPPPENPGTNLKSVSLTSDVTVVTLIRIVH